VCANEITDTDGRVVSVEYGCGAHSEAGAGALGQEHLLVERGEVYDDDVIDFGPRGAGEEGIDVESEPEVEPTGPALSVNSDAAMLPPIPAGADILSDLGVDLGEVTRPESDQPAAD
jgi:hypothetical protein